MDCEEMDSKISQLQLIVDSLVQDKVMSMPNDSGVMRDEIFSTNIMQDGESENPGPFEIESVEDNTMSMANRYYRIGGKTYEASDGATAAEGILCLKVNISGSTPQPSYVTYGSVAEMQSDEIDTQYFIMPLYTLDEDYNVVLDWRKGANLSMGEF